MIFAMLLLNLLFGIIQWLLFQFGVTLGVNHIAASGLADNQIPGFRQEANTHGKLVLWTILYSMPHLIRGKEKSTSGLFSYPY